MLKKYPCTITKKIRKKLIDKIPLVFAVTSFEKKNTLNFLPEFLQKKKLSDIKLQRFEIKLR